MAQWKEARDMGQQSQLTVSCLSLALVWSEFGEKSLHTEDS